MSAPRARKILRYAAMLDAIGGGDTLPAAARKEAALAIEAGADLSLDASVTLLERIATRAPADFALRFGASRRLVELGVVGHAILSCETLRQAHAIWQRFSGLAGDPVTYRSRQGRDAIRDEIVPFATLSPRLARFCSEEWVASFCHFVQETIGDDCAAMVLEFRHQRVADVAYNRLLPVAARFGCGRSAVTLPDRYLDAPILSRDDEMFELLSHHFAARAAEDRQGIVAQLRHLFLASAGRPPRLAEAAEQLGTSARTLNRRLAEEGTSYSAVLADYRAVHARALVREGTLGTKQIAHALGYRSHQSLRRAFAEREGQSIGRWKATQGSTTR
jgi:AraC-like DNA-binding protein